MKTIETICAVCEQEGHLTRVPSMPTYVKKNNAGSIVKHHIEEAKEQLRKDKSEARGDFK